MLEGFRPFLSAGKRTMLAFGLAWLYFTYSPLVANPWTWSGFFAWWGIVFSTPLGGMGQSVAALTLNHLESLLLPSGTQLLLLGPFDAWAAINIVGAFLAILVAVPVGTFFFAKALNTPGGHMLHPGERMAIRAYGGAAVVLFLGGFFLSLFVVMPSLFEWSALLAPAIHAQESVALLPFVWTTLSMSLLIGLAFELPVAMVVLARLGIITTAWMRKNYQYEGAGCLVGAFLISPGVGGGVMELALTFAFAGLLGIAYVVVRRVERARAAREGVPFRSSLSMPIAGR